MSFSDRIWLLLLVLGLIFASIHQTAVVLVWTLYELAKRPEELGALRSEYVTEADEEGKTALTYASLRNAERLDSFIREVMRTKGDTLSTIRQTTAEAPLGKYIIPAGSLVIPLATLAHENEEIHGEDAKQFVSDRWVGRYKPAVKVDPGYWPFGMGRWACPGRTLAIAEIKLFMLILIMKCNPRLEGDSYQIVDPMNVTAVPPQGQFLLTQRKHI
jgi:cytochrome P450